MCNAFILTKGQTYECYCQGFKLINEAVLKSICDQRYLNLFFTIQSSAETNAINSLARKQLINLHIHVLQAVWSCLRDSALNMPIEKLKTIMKIFQNICR